MPNPKHRPLRLADPAAPVPDTRASVARALLDRWFPVDPPRSDQALTMLDPDGRRRRTSKSWRLTRGT